MSSINTYSKYLRAIEELLDCNNYTMLTTEQIKDFISGNRLDMTHGITIDMVKTDTERLICQHTALDDIEYIDAIKTLVEHDTRSYAINKMIARGEFDTKYSIDPSAVRRHISTLYHNGAWGKEKVSPSEMLLSNGLYKQKLMNVVAANSPKPLTDTQIKLFIKRYQLDSQFSISIETVRSDMYILHPEYQPIVFCIDSAMVAAQITTGKANSATRQGIVVDEIHKKFLDSFVKLIYEYRTRLYEKKLFAALLKDHFPKNRAEVRTLIVLLNDGIVEEINAASSIDKFFVARWDKRLQIEYGINAKLANQMVRIWCTSYGDKILHKDCFY